MIFLNSKFLMLPFKMLLCIGLTYNCIIFLGTKQDESTNFVCSCSGLGINLFIISIAF